MSDPESTPGDASLAGASTGIDPPTAGLLLRQAREAAGLSVDAAAQQLKLSPRQVVALEEGDLARLPGPTFVRGFIRNYARLVHVDPDTVLAAMPAVARDTGAVHPALSRAPSIGELPTPRGVRSIWTRAAVPVSLIAIVGAAAVYEILRPGEDRARRAASETIASAPAPDAGARIDTVAAGDSVPNPATAPRTLRPTAIAAPSGTILGTDAGAEPAAAPAPAPSSAPAEPREVEPIALPASGARGEAMIELEFRDFSWTEVRDGHGQVLLSRMMNRGQTQVLSGAPPFDLVIGNAADVSLRYEGRPVDLATSTRQNVARLTLK